MDRKDQTVYPAVARRDSQLNNSSAALTHPHMILRRELAWCDLCAPFMCVRTTESELFLMLLGEGRGGANRNSLNASFMIFVGGSSPSVKAPNTFLRVIKGIAQIHKELTCLIVSGIPPVLTGRRKGALYHLTVAEIIVSLYALSTVPIADRNLCFRCTDAHIL